MDLVLSNSASPDVLPDLEPALPTLPASLSDGAWHVSRSELQDWLQTGALTLGLWEFLARQFRPPLPPTIQLPCTCYGEC